MKRVHFGSAVLIPGLWWLCGCSSPGPAFFQDAGDPSADRYRYTRDSQAVAGVGEPAYFWQAYDAATDESGKKRIRNEVTWELIRKVDVGFTNYVRELRGGDAAISLSSDLIVLGTSATSTAVGAASTKTVFSGITTFVSGSKAAYETTVNRDQVIEVLVLKMLEMRALKLQEISEQLSESTDAYPLTRAVADVAQYYQIGSTSFALANLYQQQATQTHDALEASRVRAPAEDQR
ncbi:MAG: hypothetical protein E1N59_1739 [Puniceicoccaceae bacterium 5H]|nr:MAG: hypothetical protein E1N59_1739 [Puniceicoccaceae bacterium 5H]